MKTIANLKVGEQAIVKSVSKQNSVLFLKLLSLGIVEGALVQTDSMAPLGDPINISTRGFHLALRLNEAENIEVTPI